jgi:hypothetical protein
MKGRGTGGTLRMRSVSNVFIKLILTDQAARGFLCLSDDWWVLLALEEPPDPQ